MSCSLQVYPLPGSSENTPKNLSLSMLGVLNIEDSALQVCIQHLGVIVISITSLSENCPHASQAVSFPHGDLAINQNLIGIVEDAVYIYDSTKVGKNPLFVSGPPKIAVFSPIFLPQSVDLATLDLPSKWASSPHRWCLGKRPMYKKLPIPFCVPTPF